MQLHPKVIEKYAANRVKTYKSILCHAPFVSMNFDQFGNARACCYNFKHILGQWPKQSLKQIWQGAKANELRKFIKENNLGGGCKECGNMIIAGNHHGVRAKYYDEYAPNNIPTRVKYAFNSWFRYLPMPKVIEFELSNECNLECVMCNGDFSSSIRKNREKRPPVVSPYNEKFVNELDPFIPHLTDAKFLGGEPFMIEIYLKIWERILKINPSVRIHITTNGTFLNNRIKDLLEGLKAGIILSIDSINKDTYNKIRINGNFQKVMEHLEYFIDYTRRKKTFISIAACPITLNWQELPEILEFCISKNIALYFNAVFTPTELSLREQTPEYLENVIQVLSAYKLPERTGDSKTARNLSIAAYADFLKLLKSWLLARKSELKNHHTHLEHVIEDTSSTHFLSDAKSLDAGTLIAQFLEISYQGFYEREREIQSKLAAIVEQADETLLAETLKCYQRFYLLYHKADPNQISEQKTMAFAQIIFSNSKKSMILEMMCKLPPTELGGFIYNKTEEELKNDLARFF